jgi:hypothetical protein
MKELDLKSVAVEFELISSSTVLFFNKETGEFDHYSDFMDSDDDVEKFEDDSWIATPSQWDVNEYSTATISLMPGRFFTISFSTCKFFYSLFQMLNLVI